MAAFSYLPLPSQEHECSRPFLPFLHPQDSQGPASEVLEWQGRAVMPSLQDRYSGLLSLGFSQQERKLSRRGSLKMSDI